MTREEKQLLLKDLSARLPYGVKVDVNFYDATKELSCDLLKDFIVDEKSVRPYLRPMSSMTKEEEDEWWEFENKNTITESHLYSLNWLNAHHFDYRGLIEKGLALEAPEIMYKHFGDMDVVVTSVEHKDKL